MCIYRWEYLKSRCLYRQPSLRSGNWYSQWIVLGPFEYSKLASTLDLVLILIPLTIALDQSRRPPIGAKTMPTAKKSGRTVFGVSMGLKDVNVRSVNLESSMSEPTYCHAFNLCWRKAVSAEDKRVSSTSMLRAANASLAGLRLFCFFSWSLWTSSVSIESVCATSVCDIFDNFDLRPIL
jgi:hypothetical protein